MALSEHEQRTLEEMERALFADDPQFGSGLREPQSGGFAFDLRAIAVGLVGLVLLIGGVALSQSNLWFIALSVVGFLAMFGAGIWMLRGGSSSKSGENSLSATMAAQARGERPRGGSPRNPGGNGGGMGDRMEDNFRRRFGQQ